MQNGARMTDRIGCVSILLKPESISILVFFHFRVLTVFQHLAVPVGSHSNSDATLFNKIRSHNAYREQNTPNGDLWTVKRSLVYCSRVFSSPVLKIVFVYCARNVEICFVAQNALCVAVTHSAFLKNVSIKKPYCSSDHGMVTTENLINYTT